MNQKIYIELTFERVARYLQCRGVNLAKEMCWKEHNTIMFNETYNSEGDLVHFYMIRFPDGAQTRGPQKIAFSEALCYEDQSYLIKKFNCNDIVEFALEFEQLECGLSPLESFEDFSYLHEEECRLPPSLDERKAFDSIEATPQTTDIFDHEYRICKDISEVPLYWISDTENE